MVVVDTDIMVAVMRGHPPALAWLDRLGDEEVVLPGYVLMEMLQGCRNQREQRRLAGYRIAWPAPNECDQAAAIFAGEHLRQSLGILDALIGQTAISLGLPLCTFNQRHYTAIPGLATIQPY